MEQTAHMNRNGWSQEETDLLWKEIHSALNEGTPLRGVFDRTGQALGRKPNSVRNYYYMQMREKGGEDLKRAAPFDAFSEEEIHDLLRNVLLGRGSGRSVRACVMEMSGGDRSRMLRYQNKYRAILRKKPDLIDQVCRELKQEGLPCPDVKVTVTPLLKDDPPAQADPDVQAILRAAASLARRAGDPAPENDRLRVQRDLLLMQVEDLQLAAKALVQDCKDFLGGEMEERKRNLPAFCDILSEHMAKLETVAG
ncbi:MAG: hypothetical protein IJJ60_05380 [Clostridia bacterium]|nr:hypothetical protein [Clostridia bacterium]